MPSAPVSSIQVTEDPNLRTIGERQPSPLTSTLSSNPQRDLMKRIANLRVKVIGAKALRNKDKNLFAKVSEQLQRWHACHGN